MHDLVHDLARYVMVDEILVAGKDGNTGGRCYHYALLNDSSKRLDASKIRALRFMNCAEIELHHASFSSAKSMRVLDLSECSIHKLPRSIGLLKHLRYLNAPRVKHRVIPDSITKLSKLIYLNLHGSQITGLPESIGDMKGLMYLDLSGCSGIEHLPESFAELQNVVHLDLSNCSHIEGVSLFLGSLKKLRYLNLSSCRCIGELPEALGGLSELQYLNLSYSSYLECSREAEFLGSLTKLEYLNLSSRSFSLKKIPEAIGNFLKLKYLNLSRSMDLFSQVFGDPAFEDEVDSLLCSITTLVNLEHLDLSSNGYIRSIPGSISNLRKLHTLNLSRCIYLWKIPESIGTIESFKTLYTMGCNYLQVPQLSSNSVSLPRFVVQADDGERSSNLVLLQHTDPAELEIAGLENVKTAEEAQSIELIGKQSMNELKLKWTRDAERSVDDKLLLEKLVPPSTVQKFKIQNYNSVSFPAWLMDITHHLPNLTIVKMRDMPNCKVLPPMDQLPNLDYLGLRDMASLEEWNTSYSSGQERVIAVVQIVDCPKLRIKPLPPRARWLAISNSDSVLSSWGEYTGASTSSSYPVKTTLVVGQYKVPIHQWRLLQHLPGHASLWIQNCCDLTGSPEVIQHLSSLPSLGLAHQQEIPKWVGELTSLHVLEISLCSGLTELPENMTQLTELHSLELSYCNSIASLPYWLGELTSLNELTVLSCDLIRSLSEGIQQLTNLQKLVIRNCPALKKWCELEEKKTELTPNQKRACVLPTSLKKLEIVYCNGISSLPEGIQQLTNLQELKIISCRALKEWCELEENMTKLAHIKDKVCVHTLCHVNGTSL
jgi:Leucine-rich repeat (LRR) protein